MPIKPRKSVLFIPPGGFQGFAEQTLATKALVSTTGRKPRKKAVRKKAPTRRTRRKTPTKRRVRRSPPPGKKARMVKGSPAAKRHMAKLRKMRGKR